jgi:hypothetical protein
LQQELKHLATKTFKYQSSGTVDEITVALETHFNNQLPEFRDLFEDTSFLLNQFKQVAKVTSFRLLLATVSTNMCRKFHTDINDLRLLCTYVGPGTLWLPDEIIDHEAVKAKRNNIILDKSLIQQVETGNVVILKGALYPKANAVIHRSPTIEESNEKRLLLRIDTNEGANFWN